MEVTDKVKEEVEDKEHIEFESSWNYCGVKEEGNVCETEEKPPVDECDDKNEQVGIVTEEQTPVDGLGKSNNDFLTHEDKEVDSFGSRSYMNPQCNTSSTQEHSSSPMELHSGEKLLYCGECNINFEHEVDLAKHTLMHSEKKLFHCLDCEKCFRRRKNLNLHIRTHTGEKPFQCGECKREFTQQQHLKRHMRTHTGEKPFYCDQCKKAFTRKQQLNKHLQKHSGENLSVGESARRVT